MQTEHLFELTYIILDKKQVTAAQMAEHFGVSQRTIYRWVDSLNLAGVPIITTKGKGGGIQLAEKFSLDKAVLSEEEKQDILSSVQAFNVLSGKSNSAISKLKAITKANADWIQVDFAPWNPEQAKVRDLFSQLKSAVLSRHQIKIEYYSSRGECFARTVDPWKIIFRGQAWYLLGFCSKRKEPRYFKLSRIQKLEILKTEIKKEEKDFTQNNKNQTENYNGDKINGFINLKIKISNSEVYRVLDEYKVDSITEADNNKKILTVEVPKMYWLKNWILSFGSSIEVLEPEDIRTEIKIEAKKMFKMLNKKGK